MVFILSEVLTLGLTLSQRVEEVQYIGLNIRVLQSSVGISGWMTKELSRNLQIRHKTIRRK